MVLLQSCNLWLASTEGVRVVLELPVSRSAKEQTVFVKLQV
jgi:hypothetical protein